MKKIVGRITVMFVLVGAALFVASAPAHAYLAEGSTCRIGTSWPGNPAIHCWTGNVTANPQHQVYAKSDGLYGLSGTHSIGWEVIDVSNRVVVGSGQCWRCTTTIGGLYGTYQMHMWGLGGTATLSNW